jgi:hypothetical protein
MKYQSPTLETAQIPAENLIQGGSRFPLGDPEGISKRDHMVSCQLEQA